MPLTSLNVTFIFSLGRTEGQHQQWQFAPSCVSVDFSLQLRLLSTCSQWNAAHLALHPHTRGNTLIQIIRFRKRVLVISFDPGFAVMGSLIFAFDCCRYIEYMCDMMAEEPIIPHSKPILISSIIMTPVPLFNKQRNGCRPFCEVYVGDERVLTTSQEYDKMKWV